MSDDIMIWKKLEEIEEKIDNLASAIDDLAEPDADGEEGEDSGEVLPPEDEEDSEEEEFEPVSKNQVSKKEILGLNKAKKMVKQEESDNEDLSDEFKE